ncbi:MAG: hypothetical protein A2831_01790 [Candidatus Yanofskybacteria bacterium RIFCSPHIGHO2_01_FULL_44_17]|uniref:Uncharacterized protein n=1 Tax=Candidatus Yanofskybacteria bacterium RIFCSPHIGHO2_01_FULL_44_17 TaxID=1802668 RepID=A0A1F8ESG0_9BACT|nr:MAG: hypothetical protein A2831_01790 [Candidatus Yanofskybacteria bacterium RIFCSPHIGHO2_01_FULL_44_17]
MEKISLKPVVKELLRKNSEEGVHFDVLSYQGAGNQEKSLGSFFVVGHIKYSEEDLSYAVSLISSLAKREYYSEQSVLGQSSKKAFEHTLGKLNEILEDFFKNKDLKLNIGLVAIAGNDIYISRLGKFKVALARDDKFIDVLNNVDLFSKDTEDAKQFSNIISGKLHPKDKIFAYFPTRSVVAREKQLNELFVKDDQDVFGQKIAQLASSAVSFSCCGVHINMSEIKEIPVETRPSYGRSILANAESSVKPRPNAQNSHDEEDADNIEGGSKEAPAQEPSLISAKNDPEQQESPRIIPAEFTLSQRKSLLRSVSNKFSKLQNISRLNFRARSRNFILLAAIIVLPLLAIILFRSAGPSSEVKEAISGAEENFRLAQSRLNQSDFKEARKLLQAAILNTADITDKKAVEVRQEINQVLANINYLSDKQPQLYSDISSINSSLSTKAIAAYSDSAAVADVNGTIFSLSQGGVSELTKLKSAPGFMFGGKSAYSIFNGSDLFGVYNLETKNSEVYSLKEPVTALDSVLYENNLYALADNSIYKYADATTVGTKRTVWGSDNASGNLISIAADGNIYAINADGKLIKYFKGKKESEVDLQIVPSFSSRIFTFKDSAFIYLADKTAGLVYILDKSSGGIKTTYSFAQVGPVSDISVSPDGSVWALSADNKAWFIK